MKSQGGHEDNNHFTVARATLSGVQTPWVASYTHSLNSLSKHFRSPYYATGTAPGQKSKQGAESHSSEAPHSGVSQA